MQTLTLFQYGHDYEISNTIGSCSFDYSCVSFHLLHYPYDYFSFDPAFYVVFVLPLLLPLVPFAVRASSSRDRIKQGGTGLT